MKTFFGILILIAGVLGGFVVAVLMLVTGIMDIISMLDTGITFWGLFWAIIWIALRELVAGVIMSMSFIFAKMLLKKF